MNQYNNLQINSTGFVEQTRKDQKVYIFLCIFFIKVEELELAIQFIKKRIGNYQYFSNNIRYESFPLRYELFSIFYTGSLLKYDQVYHVKLIGLSVPKNKMRLASVTKTIQKFQKDIWAHHYYQIPIQLGYFSHSKIVSIYHQPSLISVDSIKDLHHQTELNYMNGAFHFHNYTLSIFKTKAYLTFFNDFRRITQPS